MVRSMAHTDDSLDDTTSLLRAMVSRGFRFTHPRDANGDVIAVRGVRAHHHVIDVIELHAEHDAQAVRMPGDEQDIGQPGTTLWQTSGPAHAVLARLLALPDDAPAVPVLAKGCWVPTLPGRAT